MPRPELVTRNNAMVALFVAGVPGAEIGALFGISDARVFQILKRRGVRRGTKADRRPSAPPPRAAGAKETR